MKKLADSSLFYTILTFLLLGSVSVIEIDDYPGLTLIIKLFLIILAIFYFRISLRIDMRKRGKENGRPISSKRKVLYAMLILGGIVFGVLFQLVVAPLL